MDLNAINANINRLLTNIWIVISFFKEFAADSAKDVSITYINADGSESVKTFPNISKMWETFNITNDGGIIKDLDGNIVVDKTTFIDMRTITVTASDDMTLFTGNVGAGKYLCFISLVSDETYDKGGDTDDVSVKLTSSNANVIIKQNLSCLRPQDSKDQIRESGGSELIYMEVPVGESSSHSLGLYTDVDSTFGGYIYWKIIRLGV